MHGLLELASSALAVPVCYGDRIFPQVTSTLLKVSCNCHKRKVTNAIQVRDLLRPLLPRQIQGRVADTLKPHDDVIAPQRELRHQYVRHGRVAGVTLHPQIVLMSYKLHVHQLWTCSQKQRGSCVANATVGYNLYFKKKK